MRILVAIVALVVSITTATAQSAAPAAAPAPATPAATTAPAAEVPAAPLYAPGTTDFHVNGAAVIAATPPRSQEQLKADEEAQADWQARCRPTVVEDRDRVRRWRYAAVDCDLSPFNTAGAK